MSFGDDSKRIISILKMSFVRRITFVLQLKAVWKAIVYHNKQKLVLTMLFRKKIPLFQNWYSVLFFKNKKKTSNFSPHYQHKKTTKILLLYSIHSVLWDWFFVNMDNLSFGKTKLEWTKELNVIGKVHRIQMCGYFFACFCFGSFFILLYPVLNSYLWQFTTLHLWSVR